jgi:DNA repair photolyase
MLGRFNSNYNHSEVINPTDFKELEQSASKMRDCGKQILLSFTGDPYCNAESGETRKVLEILNFYGHKVAILTKQPMKALKDIVIFKKFGDRFKIGSTITFDNDTDSEKWEKGASSPDDRINGLEIFAKEGIKTWASFEPVIIPEQSLNQLKKVVNFIDHVKIGKINNYKGIDKQIDWAKFIFDSVRILRESNMNGRFYIKKDLLIHNTGVYLSGNETNEDYLNL